MLLRTGIVDDQFRAECGGGDHSLDVQCDFRSCGLNLWPQTSFLWPDGTSRLLSGVGLLSHQPLCPVWHLRTHGRLCSLHGRLLLLLCPGDLLRLQHLRTDLLPWGELRVLHPGHREHNGPGSEFNHVLPDAHPNLQKHRTNRQSRGTRTQATVLR